MSILTSQNNSLIKHWVKLSEDSSYRKATKSCVIEGKKMVQEAIQRGGVKQILIRDDLPLLSRDPTTFITPQLCKKISTLQTPEGYFAEIEIPTYDPLFQAQSLLVLDQIQDPGNMGTLLRSALALGFEKVFLLNHSVDPFSPKVMRASMGACLQIPIQKGTHQELLQLLDNQKYQIFLAEASGAPISNYKIQKPFALILGNESQGSHFKNNSSFFPLSIPIQNIDSLNVAIAGSLLMFQLKEAVCR